MVKMLVALVAANLVLLLEVAGVALVAAGLGTWLGVPAVLIWVGVAVLAKSVEVDLSKGSS